MDGNEDVLLMKNHDDNYHFNKLPEDDDSSEEESSGEFDEEEEDENADAEADKGDEDEESDYESSAESVDLKEVSLGWKEIVFLPYNTIWNAMIILSTLYLFNIVVYNLEFSEDVSHVEKYAPIAIDFLYLVDVVLATVYREWKSVRKVHVYKLYNNWLLFLDVISLVPADLFYLIAKGSDIDSKTLSYFRINRLLRFVRIRDYFDGAHKSVGQANITMTLLEWASYFIIMTQTCAAILHTQMCLDKRKCFLSWSLDVVEQKPSLKNSSEFDWYLISTFTLMGRLTSRSLPSVVLTRDMDILIALFTEFIAFVLFMGYILGYLNSTIIHQMRNIFGFSHQLRLVKKHLYFHKVDERLKLRVVNFYEVFWQKRYGIKDTDFLSLLPSVSLKEMSVDIYWTAFKHSHIFKHMELSFLRFISLHMTSEFFLPGEEIFHRNKLKKSMIYIVSGVVHLLSEADEVTPIISFSGGTCLGESTLLISYTSNTTVRCATFCEIAVLQRKHFYKILKDYPFHQKLFLRRILDRYKKAEELHDLARTVQRNGDESVRGVNITSIRWVKNTMEDLLLSHRDHDEENISTLSVDGDIPFNEVQFTPKNLDLYVMTQKLELVTDPICLKSTWPWILQPTSQVLSVWNAFILCVVLITAVMWPYYASFACTPLKYVMKPNETTNCQQAGQAEILQWPTTAIYLLDVLIQVLTAVRKKDELLADWKQIFFYRFTQLGFIMDMLATLPLEVFVYLMEGLSEEAVMYNLLSLNKLLKMWKLELFFRKLENSLMLDIAVVRMIKYSLYMVFIVYYAAVFMYMLSCFRGDCTFDGWFKMYMMEKKPQDKNLSWHYYDPKERPYHHITISMYVSSIIFTGSCCMGNAATNITDVVCLIALLTISSFVYIYMVAAHSATKILSVKPRVAFQVHIQSIKKFLKEQNLEPAIQERVMMFLQTSWQYKEDVAITGKGLSLPNLPSSLHKDVQMDLCSDALTYVPLFQNVSTDFVSKVAAITRILVLPPNETVTYTGEVSKEMYIIIKGYCEVMSNVTGKPEKVVGPKNHFAAVEMFLNIPSATTVHTITHCMFAVIPEKALRNIISMFPVIQMELKEVIYTCSNLQPVTQFRSELYAFDFSSTLVQMEKKSFYNFGYHWHRKSPRKFDYEHPFNELGRLGLVRFLLLRHTILPDGTFVKCWEGFRVICALLTCLYFPAQNVVRSQSHQLMIGIGIVLDIAAYLDLYVRLHICYYNSDGVLVKHPLKTALYYFKHGLLLDLLGCAPFNLLAAQKTVGSEVAGGSISFWPLLRVIQCHRVLSACIYLEQNILRFNSFITVLKFIPVLIVIINVSASILCSISCSFEDKIEDDPSGVYARGVRCHNLSWIHMSEFSQHRSNDEHLTAFKVYSYALYWTTGLLVQSSLSGITAQSEGEIIIAICLSIGGLLTSLYFISSIVASRSSRNVNLTTYQEYMHSLVNFMEHRRITNDLRKEVINYFELMWMKRRGKDAHTMFDKFHSSLKEDVLFYIYGRTLKECTVFNMAGKSFFRSLLTHMRIRIFMKHAIIIRVNDIVKHMYFLYKGRVDVLGPDGTKLQTLLRGAIIGNIDDVPTSRQTVTMKARGHVEVLEMLTTDFYVVLENYPRLKRQFEKIIALNMDFVLDSQPKEGGDQEVDADYQSSSSSQGIKGSISSIISGLRDLNLKVFMPESTFFKLWEVNVLIVGAFLNYILTSYQAALQEFHIAIMIIQYLLDLLYVLKIYLKFHMAYENEFGDAVLDMTKIAQRYLHDPRGLYLDVLTVLPLEVFAFAAGSFRSDKYLFAFSCLRLNRLGRVMFLLEYFEVRSNRLNINVFWMRFGTVLLYATLVIHTLTCTLLMLKNDYGHNWNPISWPTVRRFWEYIHGLFILVSIFTGSSFYEDLPERTYMIWFYVIVAIFIQFNVAVFVGEMCAVLEIVHFTQTNYRHKINNLMKYMRLMDISPALVIQLWKYVVHLWDHQKGMQFPILLKEAPGYLHEGIKNSLYGHHIYMNYVFSTCHTDFLRQLVSKLKQFTFFPGNYITFEGDINDNMYFIYSGEVDVIREGANYYLPDIRDTLKEGDVFGMTQGLYPRRVHSYSYRSRTLTVILVLNQLDWVHLLKYFPASKREIYERATSLHFTI